MFLLTVFAYPTALALLCAGSGLLVDRLGRATLPGALIPVAGMAALIGVTQLTTWIAWMAPASPYVVAAVALAGLIAGRPRIRTLALALRVRGSARAQLGLVLLTYLIAIAPVLLSGRPSFSSYMTLTDSAIHMVGASYLISHGSSFGHLDLRNSYGQLVNDYFNSGYPTGADTFFGASAVLLRLPMIWAFQPFNAFALALGAGPAWLLVRGFGLRGRWAFLAALSATLPALVYAYELIASVKEIVALSMLLGIAALVARHQRWLTGGPRGGIPFAILAAAGVSALGVGFGAWVLMALALLALTGRAEIRRGGWTLKGAAALLAWMGLVVVVLAWPTWAHFSSSFAVSKTIAGTSNPGNLQTPLDPLQMIGAWFTGSYLHRPRGAAAVLTYALAILTCIAAAIGVVHLMRERRFALGGWLVGSLLVWLALEAYGTTWVDAKGLMLTSPALLLCAWAGVAAARTRGIGLLAPAMAALIAGGVLVSDAIQYRASALAPTARYDEMASLNARFAGRGPTLFTDFDEYSLYELRSLDIGGPDFLDFPAGLGQSSEGHGDTVDLERAHPPALAGYPLIITRVNPLPYRPPSAYRLLWQGTYYQVWGRIHRARPAFVAVGLHGAHPASCELVQRLARLAHRHRAELVADSHPEVVQVSLARVHHSAGWARRGVELLMNGDGRLWESFRVPRGGVYALWLQGEAMPTLQVKIDGRRVASIAGQLSGNGDNPDSMTPIRVHLRAGRHMLEIARSGFSLAPGSASEAYLEAIFLTPSGAAGWQHLRTVEAARWRTLCGAHLDWIEVVPRPPAASGRGQPLRRQSAERNLARLGTLEVALERRDARMRLDQRPQVGDRPEQPDRGADLEVGGAGWIAPEIAAVDPLIDPLKMARQRGEV
jgi:hypothetical protein